MEHPNCECCGNTLALQWCDTHGVGACVTCGLPHTIYHYNERNERLEKPPEHALSVDGLEIAKRYWQEKKRRVFPGAYDMGFLGGRDTTYSGATREDCSAFAEWYEANVKEPVSAET